MENLNQAKAISAFRNKGTKAPISVMFEMNVARVGGSVQNRLVSRALGNPSSTRLTTLLSYTEEEFDKDFGPFGIKASDITTGYRDAAGQIVAKEVNLTTEQLFGEAFALRRIDTTDTNLVTDEAGNLRPQWSVKQVNGIELTHEGALIYSTVEFCEIGEESIRIQQDQDRSMLNGTPSLKENVTSSVAQPAPF